MIGSVGGLGTARGARVRSGGAEIVASYLSSICFLWQWSTFELWWGPKCPKLQMITQFIQLPFQCLLSFQQRLITGSVGQHPPSQGVTPSRNHLMLQEIVKRDHRQLWVIQYNIYGQKSKLDHRLWHQASTSEIMLDTGSIWVRRHQETTSALVWSGTWWSRSSRNSSRIFRWFCR